jgi:hypothetical protein
MISDHSFVQDACMDGYLFHTLSHSSRRAMTEICLPMPTAEETESVFGSDFNPNNTLNGAIALAAAGDLAGPAIALMRAVFTCPAADARLREAMISANCCVFELHVCRACFHSYSAQQWPFKD